MVKPAPQRQLRGSRVACGQGSFDQREQGLPATNAHQMPFCEELHLAAAAAWPRGRRCARSTAGRFGSVRTLWYTERLPRFKQMPRARAALEASALPTPKKPYATRLEFAVGKMTDYRTGIAPMSLFNLEHPSR